MRPKLFKYGDQSNIVLNIFLIFLILSVVGSFGFIVSMPQQGERFTKFYLLTENEGDLVADNYPEEFVQDETQSVIVGVENQERETVEYTIVVQLERVEGDRTEPEVIERDELDRFDRTLNSEETWHAEHEITPTITGENLRLTYLLYRGQPPEEPTKENAYRDLHLWITVEDTEAQEPIEITSTKTNTNT